MRFAVKTPEQLEEGIRAQVKRRRKDFAGFVVVHTIRDEYICAPSREDCERQAVDVWGVDSRSDWRWFEVDDASDLRGV